MDQIISEENFMGFLKQASFVMATVPAFAGVGNGMSASVKGMCEGAEISPDVSTIIIGGAFITSPLLFSMIMFAVLKNIEVKTLDVAFKIFSASLIVGFANYFSAYNCGRLADSICITKAKVKSFTLQMILLYIFVELVGLLGTIIALLTTL